MRLNEKQKNALRFIYSDKKLLIWAGSVRSGKTYGVAVLTLIQASSFSGQSFLIAGKTSSAVYRNVIPYMVDFCRFYGIDHALYRSKGELHVEDNVFYIFGADNEASQDKIQGMTIAGGILDEAPLMPESFVNQAMARMSVAGSKMIMTLNKTSPNHWIKKNWVDRIGDIKGVLIESTIDDNPDIPQETIDFYDALYTGHYKARFIDNQWSGVSGLVYPKYKTYVETGEKTHSNVVVSVDFGITNPTAALYFSEGKVFDEYYYTGQGRSARGHAVEILREIAGHRLHSNLHVVHGVSGSVTEL